MRFIRPPHRVALAASGIVLTAWVTAAFVTAERTGDLLIAAKWRGLAPDALLYTAAALIVSAPVAGAALGAVGRRFSKPAGVKLAPWRQLLTFPLSFTATSALLTLLSLDHHDLGALNYVGTLHATVACVALALSGLGALMATLFDDVLDAAACGLAVSLVASGGVLLGGAVVGEASQTLINGALTASPFVAMSSAAHIDIVRMDLLYRVSPLARLHVDYPEWFVACAWYLAAALGCFGVFAWKRRGATSASLG